MQTFEIHITGSEGINKILDDMGLKNIIVELLEPDGQVLRTEYMSSFIEKHKSFTDCYERVIKLVDRLALNTEIIRVKIESPYYEEYAPFALYMESHFAPKDNTYPMSRNQRSQKMMGTDREYVNSKFPAFIEKWKDEDVELCLYDTFVREDFDWMEKYK